MATREQQIEALATELDGLLDQLAASVDAIGAILKRPKPPPESDERLVTP